MKDGTAQAKSWGVSLDTNDKDLSHRLTQSVAKLRNVTQRTYFGSGWKCILSPEKL